MHEKLTLVSTKKIENLAKSSENVTGEVCNKNLLFFIPLSSNIDYIEGLELAVDEALKKSPNAVALSNVKIKRTMFMSFFYNQWCATVEGTPILKTP